MWLSKYTSYFLCSTFKHSFTIQPFYIAYVVSRAWTICIQYGTLAYKRCCVAAKTLTIRETLFLNLKFRKCFSCKKTIFLLQLKPILKRILKTISHSNTINRPMILIFFKGPGQICAFEYS